MTKEFYSVNGAATLLSTSTRDQWDASEVLAATESGKIPVCFKYDGALLIQSIDNQPEKIPPRTFVFRGIVRSLEAPVNGRIGGFGVLLEVVEAHVTKYTVENGQTVKGVRLPTEHPHGGRITPGHSVVCWIEECPDIGTEQFIFHADDLAKIMLTRPPAPKTVILATAVTSHSTKKGRSHPMQKSIEATRDRCDNKNDTTEVWTQLRASEIKPPIRSITPKGIEYDAGTASDHYTRAKLDKYLRRTPR